jgi:hypothetical protein
VHDWDHALDHFEASVRTLSAALSTGDWLDVSIQPLALDEPGPLTPAQQARMARLEAEWRQLEPMLLDALSSLDDEIATLAASRRGRTEYARHAV